MPSFILKQTCCAALLASTFAGIVSTPAVASSHREAPFITRSPKVDATDFYMFNSYDPARPNTVTLIANYQPLQDAYGGPNYFSMDPDALYEIHIDNDGNAQEDLTFQFRFTNTNKDAKFTVGTGANAKQVSIPLVINGSEDIATVGSGGLNLTESYEVTVVRGDRRKSTQQRAKLTKVSGGSSVFEKPVDNIGNKSISNYASYASKHIFDVRIPGCAAPGRVFVGQRKDPFVVNLGETFDLINIAAPAVEFAANAERAETDSLKDKNVTSLALEVPTSCLTAGSETTIGGWTTASLRQGRILNPSPKGGPASREGGAWSQVSRLGMPLVNEVVIGLKDKDQFNSSKPSADGQFADYVTNPTLPALVEVLFGSAGAKAPTNFPRRDLIAAFLTGIRGVNQFHGPNPEATLAEMLRLDTQFAAKPAASQNRLGVLGGDNAGFPNGRRPGDDVVDIELRVAMGVLCTINIGCVPGDAPAGAIRFTDGAYIDSSFVDTTFPYLKTPIAGSLK